jgi:membrane associated rhomboid family serine protease
MVPLRDENPTVLQPYVTVTLILLNLAVFIYQLTLSPEQLEAFLEVYAVIPRELTADLNGHASSLQGFPEPLTLITSQFIHGGFLHIGGNMLFLWIFGNNVEDKLGHLKFLIFYLSCGALAGLCQWYVAPFSPIPSLGASGAIAGVMGAYILRFPDARILTLIPLGILLVPFRIPAVFFLGLWFLQQALYGFASLSVPANIGMENGGIAYWAHAGGFVVGVILGPLLGLFDGDRS